MSAASSGGVRSSALLAASKFYAQLHDLGMSVGYVFEKFGLNEQPARVEASLQKDLVKAVTYVDEPFEARRSVRVVP